MTPSLQHWLSAGKGSLGSIDKHHNLFYLLSKFRCLAFRLFSSMPKSFSSPLWTSRAIDRM